MLTVCNQRGTWCSPKLRCNLTFANNVWVGWAGISAAEALKDALREITVMCDHIGNTFEQAEDEYVDSGGTGH